MVNRNLLRASMARIDITQKKLAELIGISSATMSNKMRGKNCFNSEEIDKICAVLGITDNAEKVNIFLSSVSHKRDGASVCGEVRPPKEQRLGTCHEKSK